MTQNTTTHEQTDAQGMARREISALREAMLGEVWKDRKGEVALAQGALLDALADIATKLMDRTGRQPGGPVSVLWRAEKQLPEATQSQLLGMRLLDEHKKGILNRGERSLVAWFGTCNCLSGDFTEGVDRYLKDLPGVYSTVGSRSWWDGE
ncbi:MAG: hypothetical protein K8D98_01865, partial [Rhodanobacter sp.]|nr:hypothetical protein [Rhodanobacter sp.]